MTNSFETLYRNGANQAELQNGFVEYVSTDVDYTAHLATGILALFNNPPEKNEEPRIELNNMTAIQYAAIKGYDRYLLGLGNLTDAALNKPYPSGITPLHAATANGHLNTVKALLQLGADPTKCNQDQQPPLFSALFTPEDTSNALIEKNMALFKLLRDANPGMLTYKDSSGETVFHLMAENGLTTVLSDSLEQAPKGALICNNAGNYPIHTAILNRQAEVLALLFQQHGVATLKGPKDQIALHYAARYGTKKIVEQCCIANPELINWPDKANKTPLMLAIEAKKMDVLDTLLEYGADINWTDYHGASILHLAIDTRNINVIEWVLQQRGIDINHLNDEQQTPLNYLRQQEADDPLSSKIELLLEAHGATVASLRR